ncbi:NAD(P)-binding protein [Mycena capillaripes]|nr:NAD(P)-binding protein [Mycena capillaripes]
MLTAAYRSTATIAIIGSRHCECASMARIFYKGVFGATGLQGSSVVERLLKDGTFTPRAITRDPESEASKKLKSRGVEVVKGDSGDKSSLVSALRGSEAVFAVTFPNLPPFSPPGAPEEIIQGKTIIDAAKEVGIKFFVFSSLPSLNKLSAGKYKVGNYDDKTVIEEYLKSSGLAYASILTGSFAEALWMRPELKKISTGFILAIPKYSPTAFQALTWVRHDVGEAVMALLKSYTDPSKNVLGKSYPVVTANITYPDLAAMISKALGVEVTFTGEGSWGLPIFDQMAGATSEYNGLYITTPVPNPDLVALGASFGTMDEFIEMEVKKRFAQ